MRDINKVMILGNATRDPELRYTPSGQAVTSFGVATNLRWKDQSGERKEITEFHNVVAWGKLAELCNQLIAKGRRLYVEGRLQTRNWEAPDGTRKVRTEIIASDFGIEDRKEEAPSGAGEIMPENAAEEVEVVEVDDKAEKAPKKEKESKSKKKTDEKSDEEINVEDIPF